MKDRYGEERHFFQPERISKDANNDKEQHGGGPYSSEDIGYMLLGCAFHNELKKAQDFVKMARRSVDFIDPQTGLTALHIAVGRNHIEMAKYLVEQGASFRPDAQGRTPSTIAAECEVSDEMCDFIAEAEAKAEGI
jgi:hypothetical protein